MLIVRFDFRLGEDAPTTRSDLFSAALEAEVQLVDLSGQPIRTVDLNAPRVDVFMRTSPDGRRLSYDFQNPRDRGWAVNVVEVL